MQSRQVVALIILISIIVAITIVSRSVFFPSSAESENETPETVATETSTAPTTGTLQTGNMTTTDIQVEPTITTVTIAMPQDFVTPVMTQTLESFVYTGATLRVMPLPDTDYRETLQRLRDRNLIDIALIRSDRAADMAYQSFLISDNEFLQNLYPDTLRTFITHDDYSFLPHALDPLISISNPYLQLNSETITLERVADRIRDLLAGQELDQDDFIPTMIGVDDILLTLISQQYTSNFVSQDYFFGLYYLLMYRQRHDNRGGFRDFIDRQQFAQSARSSPTWQHIKKQLTDCDHDLIVCAISQEYGRYGVSFFSETVGLDESILSLGRFPSNNDEIPIRMRGRIIADHNEIGNSKAQDDIAATFAALNTILRTHDEKSRLLIPAGYLSPHTQTLATMIQEPRLNFLDRLLSRATIIRGSSSRQSSFWQYSQTVSALRGDIHPDLWISDPGWDFE